MEEAIACAEAVRNDWAGSAAAAIEATVLDRMGDPFASGMAMLESGRRGAASGNRITLLQGLYSVAAYLASIGQAEPAAVLMGRVHTSDGLRLSQLQHLVDGLDRALDGLDPAERTRLKGQGLAMSDGDAMAFATEWMERVRPPS
jgi:hypothetical protein